MLVVISPAKKLDWTERDVAMSQPDFSAEALELAGVANRLSLSELKSLMKLSDNLAQLNKERFAAYAAAPAPEHTRPAVYAFAGDTYQGLAAETLSEKALGRAERHLRILSGLYGVLRPFDAIQPYRLEMGSRLKTERGANLYAYWGDALSKALNAQAKLTGTEILVNCASQEYFGAVDQKALSLRVITPQFYEEKDDGPKIVSFYAKKARGAMARFILETAPEVAEDLHGFDTDGYRYRPALSQPGKPAFSRPYPA